MPSRSVVSFFNFSQGCIEVFFKFAISISRAHYELLLYSPITTNYVLYLDIFKKKPKNEKQWISVHRKLYEITSYSCSLGSKGGAALSPPSLRATSSCSNFGTFGNTLWSPYLSLSFSGWQDPVVWLPRFPYTRVQNLACFQFFTIIKKL